jgi:condensin complex subunit 1
VDLLLGEDPRNLEFQKKIQELSISRVHQEQKKSHFAEYDGFLCSFEDTIPTLMQLLGSKNNKDITETIKLLTVLLKSGINDAEEGVQKMLVLVFSKEIDIKKAVINSYTTLYLGFEEREDNSIRKKADCLIKLFRFAD